jgi:hypothetical protein
MHETKAGLRAMVGLAAIDRISNAAQDDDRGRVESLDAEGLDRRLAELADARAGLELLIARVLVAADKKRVHRELGFPSLATYAACRLGESARSVRERLRVGYALERLPKTALALGTGRRSWAAVRELTRVAVQETEQAWLDESEGKTVRQIEGMVSGRVAGDGPDTPPDPNIVPRIVRLELPPEVYARYRDAVVKMRTEVDASLSEEQLFDEILRRALGGPAEGQAPYQVSLIECESCGRVHQQAGGEQVEVDASIREQADCDGQHLGRVDGPSPQRAYQDVTPAVRRMVIQRHGGSCAVPGCTNSGWLEVHHLNRGASRGDHDPERMVCLCGSHHDLHHQGRLILEGTSYRELRFLHVDGTPYGHRPATPAEAVDETCAAFLGLRKLGFSKARSRALLWDAMAHVGHDASEARLFEEAVRRSARPSALRGDADVGERSSNPEAPVQGAPRVAALAVSGLRSLGLPAAEARRWVEAGVTYVGRGAAVEDVIREALRLRQRQRDGRTEGTRRRARPYAAVHSAEGTTGGASMARERSALQHEYRPTSRSLVRRVPSRSSGRPPTHVGRSTLCASLGPYTGARSCAEVLARVGAPLATYSTDEPLLDAAERYRVGGGVAASIAGLVGHVGWGRERDDAARLFGAPIIHSLPAASGGPRRNRSPSCAGLPIVADHVRR